MGLVHFLHLSGPLLPSGVEGINSLLSQTQVILCFLSFFLSFLSLKNCKCCMFKHCLVLYCGRESRKFVCEYICSLPIKNLF